MVRSARGYAELEATQYSVCKLKGVMSVYGWSINNIDHCSAAEWASRRS